MTAPIVHVLAPAPAGGVETVVAALASAQVRAGLDVRLLAYLDPGADLAQPLAGLEEQGVKLSTVRSGRRYWKDVWAARNEAKAHPGSVVHSHGYRADVLGGLGSRLAKRPRVVTVHGRTGGGWKNRMYEQLQILSYRFADAVVAVSDRLRRDLMQEGVDPDRVVTIPNAWEPPGPLSRREAARRELGLPLDVKAVGWVGRLSPEKGPDLLLDVAELMDRDDVRFAIVGRGPLRPLLERRAEASGLEYQLRWCGLVPEAYRLMPAFDVVLLTSRTEGMPMVVLEAMAARIPIVAPAVGGIPEMIGDREAFLVPSPEPAELAQALNRVLERPGEADERAARAAVRREREFGVETWVRRYGDVYDRLIEVT